MPTGPYMLSTLRLVVFRVVAYTFVAVRELDTKAFPDTNKLARVPPILLGAKRIGALMV